MNGAMRVCLEGRRARAGGRGLRHGRVVIWSTAFACCTARRRTSSSSKVPAAARVARSATMSPASRNISGVTIGRAPVLVPVSPASVCVVT